LAEVTGGVAQLSTLGHITRFRFMDTNEKTLALVKAQSALLLDLAERVVILNCAFEAYVQKHSDDFDGYVELRKKMFDEDFHGKTNDLLRILKTEMDRVDNYEKPSHSTSH
jgi:hypothetical protein